MREVEMRRVHLVWLALALVLTMSGAAHAGKPAPDPPTGAESGAKDFEDFDPKNFSRSHIIDNEWWPLRPGTQFTYEGSTVDDNGERIPHRLLINVTDLTKVIGGVRAVVVYELDYSENKLVESELAFFAQDNDGAVWHLGQYRETYDDKEFVGGRAFLVGHLEGARAGIMMPARPQTGKPSYSQGYGPKPYNWTDRARVYQIGQKTRVPTGSYQDVLVIEEFNQEEPGAAQLKFYARGVGNVRAGGKGADQKQEMLELAKVVQLDPEALAEVRGRALKLEERAYVYGSTPRATNAPVSESSAGGSGK
jgi:hypothetical protein